jgi:hypothetical protein
MHFPDPPTPAMETVENNYKAWMAVGATVADVKPMLAGGVELYDYDADEYRYGPDDVAAYLVNTIKPQMKDPPGPKFEAVGTNVCLCTNQTKRPNRGPCKDVVAVDATNLVTRIDICIPKV